MQNYDPYLNTYNYPYNNSEPSSSLSYQNNQMPDSRMKMEGYGDPDMSYSNAYDTTDTVFFFKEGGSVKEEDLTKTCMI